MLERLVEIVWVCFLGEETKMKYSLGIRKMFETMVWVEILEGYKRAVRDTCIGKFHGEHLPEFFISSQWLGASIQ